MPSSHDSSMTAQEVGNQGMVLGVGDAGQDKPARYQETAQSAQDRERVGQVFQHVAEQEAIERASVGGQIVTV
jgi:hypothetical protein